MDRHWLREQARGYGQALAKTGNGQALVGELAMGICMGIRTGTS